MIAMYSVTFNKLLLFKFFYNPKVEEHKSIFFREIEGVGL